MCWNRQEARRSIKTKAVAPLAFVTSSVGIDRKLEGALRLIVLALVEIKT